MKCAVLASLVATAAAFAPAKTASQSSAMSMSFENELGAQAPLGFWVRFLIDHFCCLESKMWCTSTNEYYAIPVLHLLECKAGCR